MNILLVAATSKELTTLKSLFENNHPPFSLTIHYLLSGIGNYSTIFTLTHHLNHHPHPDLLLNIGICGYAKTLSSKVVTVGRIIHLITNKELIPPPCVIYGPLVTCGSHELPVTDSSLFSTDIDIVDMESRGIGYVAQRYRLPYICLKVPIDYIGPSSLHINYDDACYQLSHAIDPAYLLTSLHSRYQKKTSI